jgi:outer membrane protein insertion porin family
LIVAAAIAASPGVLVAQPDAGVPQPPSGAPPSPMPPEPEPAPESEPEPDAGVDGDAAARGGDPAPAAEPGSEAPAASEPAAPEPLDLRRFESTGAAPPLTSWSLEGHLIEDEEIVRSFLRPELKKYARSWNPNAEREIISFLRGIGYNATIHSRPLAAGIRAVITLEPVTLVRLVKFEILKPPIDRFLLEPIFADRLRRRMTLRPGAALAPGREARAAQLRAEAERLAFHLRNDGYFEAEVSITSKPKGPYAAELDVIITPGPGYTVGAITVVGNNPSNFTDKEIVSLFHHERCLVWRLCAFKRRFTRDQLGKDLAAVVKMYQRRGHYGVRVRTDFDMRSSFKRETKTVEFTVEIRERRRIDVRFVGNSGGFTELDLAEVVTFSEEGAYDDIEVAASAEAIQRHYQSRGYFQASVTFERASLSYSSGERDDRFDRIYFYIDEGRRMPVRAVQFAGNETLPDGRLRRQIKTRVFRSLIIGESGGFATSLQLEQDADRIRQLYSEVGFREAEVEVRTAPRRELLESAPAVAAAVAARLPSDGLFVRFVIDEGPREEVSRIEFEFTGPSELPVTDLRRAVSLEAGAPYLEEVAARDADSLRELYFSRGYPRAQITPKLVRPEDLPNQVIVVYAVAANRPARIGRIALRGNFKTRRWVILDEMQLRPGQVLTLQAEDRAQSSLQATGLFTAVNLDYVGRENPRQDIVNLVVNVEERYDNRGELEASAGFSTDRGAFVGTGYRHRNIGGVGVRLDGDVIVGNEEQRLEAKVALPRWIMRRGLGTALDLETSALYLNEKIERFGFLQTIGASIGATKTGREGFFRGWLLSLRYDFRQRNRDAELVRPAGASDDVRTDKLTTRSSTVGPVLAIDKRKSADGSPSPLAPTRGYFVELRGQFGENTVLGTDRFIKLGGAGQLYIPLSNRLLLSNGVSYDHGIPLDGASLLPDVERYFAGGDTTVRGFEEDRMATEIIRDSLSPLGGLEQFRVLPAGGNIRLIHKVELQVELWEPTAGVSFASALFLDTGLIANSLERVELADLRHSVGMTIVRLSTPFGRFGFEWAIPLDPELGDNPLGRFHFNVGFLN